MTMSDRDPFEAALGARLRADAATFGAAPSPQSWARLAQIPRAAPRATWSWRAAAAIVGVSLAIAGGVWATRRASPAPSPVAVRAINPQAVAIQLEDLALQPLRTELDHLVSDSRAIARGVWRRVPAPIRGWLE
jgi:hypothetical protein